MRRIVETLPSGRHRVREEYRRNKWRTVGTYTNPVEAERVRAHGEQSVQTIGPPWIDRRELRGYRDTQTERSRWRCYVERDPIGEIPLRDLHRRDVKAWVERLERRLGAQTIRNALNLLRGALDDCVDHEVIDANPAADVRLRRGADATTEEAYRILDPREQVDLLDAVPFAERPTVALALFSGLRQGEQWALPLSCVDLERRELVVRFGSRGRPTKKGKTRRTPLIDLGYWAAREAVSRASADQALAFPTVTGERRQKGAPDDWHAWVRAAGIRDRVRWHDLRHTCATSLLAGWWGRKWSIDEVRQMLGHSSVKVTERYAHLLQESLVSAARSTPGLGRSTAWISRPADQAEIRASSGSRSRDLRFTKTGGTAEVFGSYAVRAIQARVNSQRLSEERLAALILEGVTLAKARPRDGWERMETLLAAAVGEVSP